MIEWIYSKSDGTRNQMFATIIKVKLYIQIFFTYRRMFKMSILFKIF